MPRRGDITPRTLEPDRVYNSRLVQQVINKVMLHGKKATAEALARRGTYFFTPYIERDCLRSETPDASSVPRITL